MRTPTKNVPSIDLTDGRPTETVQRVCVLPYDDVNKDFPYSPRAIIFGEKHGFVGHSFLFTKKKGSDPVIIWNIFSERRS